jgi:hypothetical protein
MWTLASLPIHYGGCSFGCVGFPAAAGVSAATAELGSIWETLSVSLKVQTSLKAERQGFRNR